MTTVTETLKELKAQRAEMVDQIRLLDDAIRSLERIAQKPVGISADVPGKSTTTQRKGPGTTEAIMRVLSEADRPLQDGQILQVMQQRGWAPRSKNPLNALRASLSRLRRDGQIERRERDGAYLHPGDSEASREQEASDQVPNQGGSMDPP